MKRCIAKTKLGWIVVGIVMWSATVTVGCSPQADRPRLIILGIDGLDPLAIDLLISENQLPNLARLKTEGAYGHLVGAEPRLSPILWTTMATGKVPADHGIAGFSAFNTDTGERYPVNSEMRKVKALWNIASDYDQASAVVGWWATWPAETIKGAVVSDHTCYHFLFQQGFDGGVTDQGLTHPPELAGEIQPMVVRPSEIGPELLQRFVNVPETEFERDFDFSDDLSHFRWVLATTESYRKIGLDLWRRNEPELLMVYLEGVDSASHLFGHLFRAEGLAGELITHQERYGDTVEEMYRYADEIVGEYLEIMDDNTTLVVMSDHGFMLGELHDDPTVTRDMRRVDARFHRPEGVIFFAGKGVKPGALVSDARQIDVLPTALRLLGLPVARDLPGKVLSSAFSAPLDDQFVDTFEEPESGRQETTHQASNVDAEILEHLEALGYLDAEEDTPESRATAAGMAFHAGRHDEAIQTFSELVKDDPDNPHLRVSLAGALGAVGRYDEAGEHLDAALRKNPMMSEGYHNRGTLYERQGRLEDAAAQYRLALRYSPHYAPSSEALDRLLAVAPQQKPDDPVLVEALRLAEAAKQSAMRGDLEGAARLLDQAEELRPKLAIIYQHRSNVRYMQGDLQGALQAVGRALELNPDDPLFQHNREQLLKALSDRSESGDQ